MASLMAHNFPNLSQQVHLAEEQKLLQDLNTVVSDEDLSVHATDFRKGVATLQTAPPLSYTPKIKAGSFNQVRTQMDSDIHGLTAAVKWQEDQLSERLTKAPISSLAPELQRIRLSKGSNRELLEAAYKIHRRGGFDPRTCPDKSIDGLISTCLVDATRLKLLNGAQTNAQDTLNTLEALESEKQELYAQLKEINSPEAHAQITQQLAGIEARWSRESNKLQDCLQRCQNTDNLNSLSPALNPHMRKIIYLQYRLGVVLRPDQMQALHDLTQNPSILVSMRMGLGKTSILVPLALEILASEGYNAIGMVPKGQFQNNFEEMDETMRLVFELSGDQLLFSRDDASKPLTTTSLQLLSEKCANALEALAAGEYFLTTIEAKASLDNKITELEAEHAASQERLGKIKPNSANWPPLYQEVMRYQIALDMLYRVKDTFEQANTRLTIDEADSVARATYSVNAETGNKVLPPPSSAIQ